MQKKEESMILHCKGIFELPKLVGLKRTLKM